MKHAKPLLIATILVAYLLALIKLIVFRFPPEVMQSGLNLVPFATILPQLTGEPSWSIAIKNLVGNIAVFMPLGFLAPFLYSRISWRHVLIGGAATSIAIETLQLALKKGSFDVDDILLNTLGVAIGYLLFACGKNFFLTKK